MKFNFKSFLKAVLPVLFAAGLGSLFVYLDYVNYDALNKPFLTPPAWVFPIAWTIIYILCIISTYIFDTKVENKETRQKGLINFYINMFLNLMWSVAFFGLGKLIVGLIVIVLLYLSTLSTYLIYRKVNRLSGNLLIPYLLWLLLATYLNICIVFLN